MTTTMRKTAAPASARPKPEDRPPSGGWRIIAAKELTDHLGSVRFAVLFVVMGFAGAAAIYSVSQQIINLGVSANSSLRLFLMLFAWSASDVANATQQTANTSLPSFVALIAWLAPLFGIAFGFDAVNRERSDRTLPRLLAQPIYRDDVINGKFAAGLAAIAIALGAMIVVIAAWGVMQIGVVPSPEDVVRVFLWYIVAVIYIGLWLALAMLCSVVMRRAASAALVAIALWLVLSLFGGLVITTIADVVAPSGTTQAAGLAHGHLLDTLTRVSPDGMFQVSTQAILNPNLVASLVVGQGFLTTDQLQALGQQGASPNSILSLDQSLLVVGPQVLAIIALTVICFAFAYIAFMRQEVRA